MLRPLRGERAAGPSGFAELLISCRYVPFLAMFNLSRRGEAEPFGSGSLCARGPPACGHGKDALLRDLGIQIQLHKGFLGGEEAPHPVSALSSAPAQGKCF